MEGIEELTKESWTVDCGDGGGRRRGFEQLTYWRELEGRVGACGVFGEGVNCV